MTQQPNMTKANQNEHFYSGLKAFGMALPELLSAESVFKPIPDSWHVIITDIKNSTQSVLGGRHEEVNLVATGSIVTVLNIAYDRNVTVPFFFGGDGATFIVPPSLIVILMDALSIYRANTRDNFSMELRTGTLPVRSLYDKGFKISIAKYKSSAVFDIPIVLGNGLEQAERIIKGEDYLFEGGSGPGEIDLSGMQCRWDKIAAPEDKEEIITLLIIAGNFTQQPRVFKKVLQKMDEVYGSPEKRQPISMSKLKLKTTFGRLGTEMRARIGRIKWMELIRDWLVMLYGKFYFRTAKGKTYLKSLIEMSDTLVIDGKINTVISGTTAQRRKFQELLDTMENDGDIYYGIHISAASIMSCYVRNLEDSHIHFVDGSEGGYTQAARMLKAKLNSRK